MADEIVRREAFQPLRAVRDEATKHESLEQVVYVFFRRKWLILGLFLSFFGAAAIAVWSMPPVRSASAKILLKSDRLSLQISELSPASARVPYSAELLESEMELMRSRNVLLPVAKRLLSEQKSAKAPSEERIGALAEKLGKRLDTAVIGQTSVIELTYRAKTGERAERILGMIVDQYLEEHAVAYSGSTQLLSFYDNEKERAQTALREAEDRFQKWQEDGGIVAIEPQIHGLLEQRSSLERERATNAAGMQVAVQENELLNRLQANLATVEVELADLLGRYTEKDRRVQEKRATIALLESQITSTRRKVLSTLAERQSTLEKEADRTTTALAGLRAKKLEGERLTRTIDVNREAFLLYGKKLEDARISHQLNREQLSNIAVVEQPHATSWTDAQERAGMVTLAGMVGLTLGIVGAFLLTFFNQCLRTRRDVEIHLGVPVLATIPQIGPLAIPDLRRKS